MTERTVLVLHEDWGPFRAKAELNVLDPAVGDVLERGPDGVSMVARTVAGEPLANPIDPARGAELLAQGRASKVDPATGAEKPAPKRGGKAKG